MLRRRAIPGTPDTSDSNVDRERNFLSDQIPAAQHHDNVHEPSNDEHFTRIPLKETRRNRRYQRGQSDILNVHIHLFIGQMVFFIVFAIILYKIFKITQTNNSVIPPAVTKTTTITHYEASQPKNIRVSTVTETLHANINRSPTVTETIHVSVTRSSTVTETIHVSVTQSSTVTETRRVSITKSSTVTKTTISTIYRPFNPNHGWVNRKWFGKPPFCANYECPYGSREILKSHYADTESPYSPCLLKREKSLDGRLYSCLESWSLNCWEGRSVLCEAPVDPRNPTAFPV